MKKLIAILLAVALFASMATVVSAANTTTLTTTVPAATYTLNIPANQEIPFGAEYTKIGEIKVSESEGFAEGKNLKVKITYEDFTCEGINTTIPFVVNISKFASGSELYPEDNVTSGRYITFKGQSDGSVEQYIKNGYDQNKQYVWIKIDSKDWGKALGGEYTATITFTAEVVSG